MSTNVLYELEKITDDPTYEGFAFVRSESLRNKKRLTSDFMPDDISMKGRRWSVTLMTPTWIPQQVKGRVRASNDYPCVNLSIPAFSRRALEVLRDLLEPNGELLPLVSSVGEYYAYNVTTVVDLLSEKSIIQWQDDKKICAVEIAQYEPNVEKMKGLSIFRLVEKPASVFVTQTFCERVQKSSLKGFHFIKLWPLPPGMNWRHYEEELKPW
jgi:hypothetical protein